MLQSLDAASAGRERAVGEMLVKQLWREWGVVRLTRVDRHRALPPRFVMKKSALFIHGAGTGPRRAISSSPTLSNRALGGKYDVQCPQTPDE